jgi:hypothetical protein
LVVVVVVVVVVVDVLFLFLLFLLFFHRLSFCPVDLILPDLLLYICFSGLHHTAKHLQSCEKDTQKNNSFMRHHIMDR